MGSNLHLDKQIALIIQPTSKDAVINKDEQAALYAIIDHIS
jgi:hypothetical protein